MTKRVAILISGGGSNMVTLAKSMTGDHPARPVLVMSNDPNAGGLAKARAMSIATFAIDHKPFGKDRAAFEAALHQTLTTAKPERKRGGEGKRGELGGGRNIKKQKRESVRHNESETKKRIKKQINMIWFKAAHLKSGG